MTLRSASAPDPQTPAPAGGPWIARARGTDAPPRVLLADEDALTVRVLRHRFERDGLAVAVAATGTEALASLAAGRVDVAVLNVALLGVDGFDLLRRVRAGEFGRPELPVALLCWAGNDALVVRSFADGADDVLTRPFSLAEASARVQRLVRRAARPDR